MQTVNTGTIIYKKTIALDPNLGSVGYAIVELMVIEKGFIADFSYDDSVSADNDLQKCRVRAAKVLKIEWHVGNQSRWSENLQAVSAYCYKARLNTSIKYVVGKTVRPVKEFDIRNIACASGIHGFLEKQKAEEYNV